MGHTPGPWWAEIRRTGSLPWWHINTATVHGEIIVNTGEEDARLIAAAPELLAALKVAANAIDYGQAQVDSEEDRYKLRTWLVQVKRVIAKAEEE